MKRLILVTTTLLLVLGCGGEEERLKTQRDIANLQEQIYTLERNQEVLRQELRDEMQAVSKKVENRSSQAEMQEQVFQIRDTVSRLQARLEELDQQIDALSKKRTPVIATPNGPNGGPGETVSGDLVQQLFNQARLDMDAGKYDIAIMGFEEILQNFPDSPFTEQARYYLGKAYFETKRYGEAVEQFAKITEDFPEGDFVRPAMYYLGQCYYYLNQYARAINTLQALIENHPNSQEANLAAQFLERANLKQ